MNETGSRSTEGGAVSHFSRIFSNIGGPATNTAPTSQSWVLNSAKQLSFKDRAVIILSRIEMSHVIMVLMAILFVAFFAKTIVDYVTHRSELSFCDSTMRQEAVKSEFANCLPCPQHAVCLSGNVKCKDSFILENKQCKANPMMEGNILKYINAIIAKLAYQQAQYYCYDPHSAAFGGELNKQYKEHKWEDI